ncbi:adhesion G protein-coupled receptor L4-like [Orbicella faveolata]|uniref:adhesion G protein-coupled receptor L4-like n=1 Tax=Orbicella faveolata TaxID=48498 RepID=UPI0009E3CF2E|nr:adhesion G protein-coupled receptor L4-like [Orbicella faveolata]
MVGIVYRNLHEELISTENNRKLNTMIMAAAMDPKPKQLQQNITLNFRNLKAGDGERFCTFWSGYSEESPDGWSEEGCHFVRSKSSSVQTECGCNHMTHFAVLFDYGDNPEITEADEKILTIFTYVGLSLSIAGLILTIIAYSRFTDAQQPLSQIRMSLAGSLGAAQVIFLGGINFTESTVACVTVAALMQYFLMAAFFWMLVEGIYLYLNVVKVYNINNKMTMYYVMSWGFPAAVVAVSLSITAAKNGIQSFVSDEYCWMSPDSEVIWIFVAFLVMIEVINLLLLSRVIWEMTTMKPKGEHRIQRIRLGIKACLMLIPLLGFTWLFGLLSPFHKAFVYIFTILNSTQGFLIFLLHCMRNSQIRDRFKRKMNTIFPAVFDENPAKKTLTSQANRCHAGLPKKIVVLSYRNSEFELKQ